MSCDCASDPAGSQAEIIASAAKVIACNGGTAIYPAQQVLPFATAAAISGDPGWISCYSLACLMCGNLLYFKTTPGDCGTPTKPQVSGIDTLITQGTALAVNAVVPGLGSFAASIESLFFGSHAAAVANEQNL